ncbi:DNA repair protein RecO [Psychrobacter sp. FDAARGOS_221]|uniref:DNA repair protein RecO n=1 Tax=Psychrobacter sp. FDAARGOS_221 TaxID=1975705 RepID=UPI000BB58DBC|nr:DNA repair protein RecO C-terminal domain-containing protein [Psychrobacter sp. FDAARGOS_221]PNK60379.1 DNA recombination protein RecO [Psychrobacter sp. FDAARGOS_221]
MRNEPLHAYSLHQRAFQDKRSIYYLLTKEHGVLHGIAKKGIPQFAPLTLFATGKKSLKTLQQVNIATTVPSLVGQQQYAALYVNEITLKLLPVEDSVPIIYEQYNQTMCHLQQPLDLQQLKLVLRRYEYVLFNELGFAIDLEFDSEQLAIDAKANYRFAADRGWVRIDEESGDSNDHLSQHVETLTGDQIIVMRSGIDEQSLDSWSLVHRQLVDHLFDYQPLQSRILWQQFHRYQ